MRALKAECDTSRRAALSAAACRATRRLAVWQASRRVLLYYPLPGETDVRPLLDEALALGRQVLLPAVTGDDLELRAYTGPSSLRPGAFGIMEPQGPPLPAALYPGVDLAVVPGMAFDLSGGRLGRGRGYYDRLLPRLTGAFKLGVCFPFQLFPSVPSDAGDVAMDGVVCL